MKRVFQSLMCFPILAIGACSEGGPTGPGIKIAVAPLSLPGVGGACYDIEVSNGTSVVWKKGDKARTLVGANQALDNGPTTPGVAATDTDTICSGDYGNKGGGSITYIGTCDSTVDADASTPAVVENRVTIWIDGLYNAGYTADIGEWRDPCNPVTGCQLLIPCNENEDSLAEFDFTIMRDANQGFFDIAVNFDDIFCSAKFDCDAGNLLFASDSERHTTAVLGFACTTGVPDAGDPAKTFMYLDDLQITCGSDLPISLPTATNGTPGNQMASAGSAFGITNPVVFQYAIYEGKEFANADFDKNFWNVAIGFNTDAMAGKACTLTTRGTASETPLTNNAIDVTASYPYIDWTIALNGTPGGDALTCGELKLNEGLVVNNRVTTKYTPPRSVDEPVDFTNCGTQTFTSVIGGGADRPTEFVTNTATCCADTEGSCDPDATNPCCETGDVCEATGGIFTCTPAPPQLSRLNCACTNPDFIFNYCGDSCTPNICTDYCSSPGRGGVLTGSGTCSAVQVCGGGT